MSPSRLSVVSLVLAIACLLALPSSLVAQGATPETSPAAGMSADVPVYRANPGRTGAMPGPGPTSAPTQLWRFQANGGINTSPAIVAGVVYAGSEDGVTHALDAATGEERWSFATDGPAGFPTVDGGLLYMGSGDGNLYALDAATGEEAWRVEIGARVGSPVVVEGVIYAAAENGLLVALDAATGREQWRQQLPEGVLRGPAYEDGLLFVGNEDGHDYALDAATGEIRWSFELGFETGLTPSVADGVVYLGARTGDTTGAQIAVDAATGTELWRFQTPNGTALTNATIADGMDYLGDYVDGTIWAIDIATGTERWHTETDGTGVSAVPSVAAGVVYYVTRGGEVGALDAATGAELWTFTVDSRAEFSAIVSNGVLYLGTIYGGVYAIGDSGQPATPVASPAGALPVATPSSPIASPAASPVAAAPVELLWSATEGSQPFVAGQLAVAPDGQIWVSDAEQSNFQIFAPDGTFVEEWGTPGEGDGQFNFRRNNGDPFGDIAWAPDGTFYVADVGNQRIQHFDRDRTFLGAWGGFGPGDGKFISPISLAVDADGNVFVDDDIRNDVQKFTADGTFLLTFGGLGSGPGQLDFQGFLAIDPMGNVWVADPSNHRVQAWDNDGRFLRSMGEDGSLDVPLAIAFDAAGRMFVADAGKNQILVFDAQGQMLGSWGAASSDSAQGQEILFDVAVDGQGDVYVATFIDVPPEFLPGPIQKFRLLPPLGDEAGSGS